MYLYHYYDKKVGPFRNISDLSIEEAEKVLADIRNQKPHTQCALRRTSYVQDRRFFETILREEFAKKNGIMERLVSHYMVVEHSPWLETWFEDCGVIKIPIEEFDIRTLSFTYGDSHPTFSSRVNDQKEYRKKLYTYEEILQVIDKYGLPQNWNDDGRFGPERYIEVHVWSDKTIEKYCKKIENSEEI